MNADVIIPTYKPDTKFFTLIARLIRQTVKPQRIIIMNTDEEKWDLSGAEDRLIESGASPLCEDASYRKKGF
jgi:rhamnosyltransferase